MRRSTVLCTALCAVLVIAMACPSYAQQGRQQGGQQRMQQQMQQQRQGGQQQGRPGPQFGRQQITQERAEGQGASLYISPAAVRLIQQRLNRMGYDPGSVDGIWNESTQRAVVNYQQANGLEPTGSLNIRTIASLGMSQALMGQVPDLPKQVDQQLAQEVARQGGTRLHVSPATLRLIQQSLNSYGYQAGNVQGVWDQETSRALQNFQEAQGLEPTGNLNLRTISALGMDRLISQIMQGGGQAGMQQADQRLTQERARDAGARLYISPAGVRQIQQSLNAVGYDTGRVDGSWDRNTSTAVRNFQQARGLEPTGNLNLRTIRTLGLGQLFVDTAGIAQASQQQGMGGQQFGRQQQQRQQFGQQRQQQGFGQASYRQRQPQQQFGQQQQRQPQWQQQQRRQQQFGQPGFGQQGFGQQQGQPQWQQQRRQQQWQPQQQQQIRQQRFGREQWQDADQQWRQGFGETEDDFGASADFSDLSFEADL